MKDDHPLMSALVNTLSFTEQMITTAATGFSLPIVTTTLNSLGIKDSWIEYKMRMNCESFLKGAVLEDIKSEELYDLVPLEEYEEFFSRLNLTLIDNGLKEKAYYVGRLLHAFMKKQISYEEFDNFSLIIHSSSLPALNSLNQIKSIGYNGNSISKHLPGPKTGVSLVGKYSPLAMSTGLAENGMLTEEGITLVEICFQKEIR